MDIKIASLLVAVVMVWSCALASESEEPSSRPRTIERLVGGHLTLHPTRTPIVKPNRDNWDDGILLASAGRGSEKKKKKENISEDKKTLADQVAEGKYGLIQKEMFSKPQKRPGILSYSANPEFVGDNSTNYGGLNPDEIWLAEDHLLVVRGGEFYDDAKLTKTESLPPIDDYQAPRRQVKIPHNPQVPPPFPVQLTDKGPLEFLRSNGSWPVPFFPIPQRNESFASPLFPFGGNGNPSLEGPFYPPTYPGNFTPGEAPYPIAPFPYPVPGYPGNASLPPLFPPMNNSGPYGALPVNISDMYDEDDPSIYYPPPYSFQYMPDNTSIVPAGPLVPGIILPPPPDFFAPLVEITNVATPRPTSKPPTELPYIARNRPTKRPKTTTTIEPPTQIYSTTISSHVSESTPHLPLAYLPHRNNAEHIMTTPQPVTYTLSAPDPVFRPIDFPRNQQRPSELKKKIKLVTHSGRPQYDGNYYEINSVSATPKPFVSYGSPPAIRQSYPDRTYVSSAAVPLRAYYSNQGGIENTLVTASPHYNYNRHYGGISTTESPAVYLRDHSTKSAASYFFYEEQVNTTPMPNAYDKPYYSSVAPVSQFYYNEYNPAPGYNRPSTPSPRQQQYVYVTARPGSRALANQPRNRYLPTRVRDPQYFRQASFNEEIAHIQQTLDYYTTQSTQYAYQTPSPGKEVDPNYSPHQRPSLPVYEYSLNVAGYENGQKSYRTLRLQTSNDEPFRPMVTYSLPYNGEQSTLARPLYDKYQYDNRKSASSEAPLASKYYTTMRPQHKQEYDSSTPRTVLKQHSQYTPYRIVPTPSPPPPRSYVKVHADHATENPIHHAYFTKQEEGLFDEITKKYFTVFGQKLQNSVTEPLNSVEVKNTTPSPNSNWLPYNNNIDNRIYHHHISQTMSDENKHSQQIAANDVPQQGASLASDTLVNYIKPRPRVNPLSEFVPIVRPNAHNQQRYQQQLRQQQHEHQQELQLLRRQEGEQQQQRQQYAPPASLNRDTLVNYRNPRPTLNPDSELVPPINRHSALVEYYYPAPGRSNAAFP